MAPELRRSRNPKGYWSEPPRRRGQRRAGPDGEGATIQLAQFGEVGFRNEGGLLVLTVPWGMSFWLRQKLGDAIVRGPEGSPAALIPVRQGPLRRA